MAKKLKLQIYLDLIIRSNDIDDLFIISLSDDQLLLNGIHAIDFEEVNENPLIIDYLQYSIADG